MFLALVLERESWERKCLLLLTCARCYVPFYSAAWHVRRRAECRVSKSTTNQIIPLGYGWCLVHRIIGIYTQVYYWKSELAVYVTFWSRSLAFVHFQGNKFIDWDIKRMCWPNLLWSDSPTAILVKARPKMNYDILSPKLLNNITICL